MALRELLADGVYREERWGLAPLDRPIIFFELHGDTVWGATGAMLRNLLAIVTGAPGSSLVRRCRQNGPRWPPPVAGRPRPGRFAVHRFTRARVLARPTCARAPAACPVLLVHGWPETKRICWRVIQPLVEAGFEVIVPDLRGFGDSDVAPDGFHDVPPRQPDLHALVHDHLGHERVVLVGGDLGGPVVQDLALRFPELRRPHGAVQLAAAVRQGAHGRPGHAGHRAPTTTSSARAPTPTPSPPSWPRPSSAAATSPPSTRRGSGPIPGRFDDEAIAFHAEPFGDGDQLRASFGGYESVFDRPGAASGRCWRATRRCAAPSCSARPTTSSPRTSTAWRPLVFADHVGPFLLRDCGHFVPWEAPHALVSAIVSLAGRAGSQ